MSKTLLPPNSTELERALEAICAQRLESIPRLVRSTADPDTIPAEWLPWLAWAWRVENWDSAWSDSQKRASIKASFGVHRKKGTFGAIRDALDALGLGITVVEWFDDTPKGAPYTFRLTINPRDVGLTETDWQMVGDIVATTKNARSHLAGVNVDTTTQSTTQHGAACSFGVSVDLPAAPNHPDALTTHLSATNFGVSIELPEGTA